MSNYDTLLRQAERMKNNLRDFLDIPNHAQARQVQSNIDALISDIRGKKTREAIDSRLKTIISSLDRVDEEVMDFHHSNQLSNMCENLRSEARNL